MSEKPEYALIVAGGKGSRMNTPVPKQFILLNNEPVLIHTIRAFYSYSDKINIIVVLPEDEIMNWENLCSEHDFKIPHKICEGGATRFQSVKNGLRLIEKDGLVAIHDGVRPLVSENLIAASFRIAAIHDAAIAAVRLKDSIRFTDQDTTTAVDRSKFRVIQTPQTFKVDLIRNAYNINEDPALTDDASVAEKAGVRISLFEGSYNNIKITTKEDIVIAEALLKKPG